MAHDFELVFLMENSRILKRQYEVQSDLNTLPPYRFTIGKRGLFLAGSLES